jgi:iron complex outermembrane recepter protein
MLNYRLMLTAAVCALAAPALAQETPAPQSAQADEGNVGDIVVTATRRSEALSDVPLAVSAVTAQSLANSGASDIRALNQLSPSLLVSSTSSEAAGGGARIRGIGTVGDNPGLESSVATFVDGVYRSRAGVGLSELGAIDRIEVLRGPQGTLFGRNASAGLISVITAKPSFNFGAEGEATYGNYNALRISGGVTGPLSETIAARIDGVYFKRDGFLKDVISGRQINGRDRYLVRGQLLIQPNDDLSVRIIGDYANRKEECCGAAYLPFGNATRNADGTVSQTPSTFTPILRGLGANITDNTYARQTSITPGANYRGDVRDWGVSGEVNWKFGDTSFTSITAYRDWRLLRGQDADFNNLDILQRPGTDTNNQRQTFKTFTQELRLQGTAFSDKLDWLIGGYYANEDLKLRDNLQYGADYERFANCLTFASVLPSAVAPTPTGSCVNVPVVQGTIANLALLPIGDPRRASIPVLSALIANPARPGIGSLAAALGQPTLGLNGVGLDDRWSQNSRNFAFFTHNVIRFTDRLNLTLGARYTNERKTLDATLTDNNALCRAISASPLAALQQLSCVIPSVPNGSYTQNGVRKSEERITGTAVLSFKPVDDLLTYVSYSRGYKAGGFNLDRASLYRAGRTANANGVGAVDGTVLNTNQLQFQPELVNAFEFGYKLNKPGFDLNIAAFYQLFDQFQLNTFNGVNFVVENITACDTLAGGDGSDSDLIAGNSACAGKRKSGVRSAGLEIEAFMRPVRHVGVNLGLTYVNTTYRDNLTGVVTPINTTGSLAPAFFQLPGRRLSNSAEYVTTGSFSWTPPIGDSGMSGLIYTDFRYQSDTNTGSDLDIEKVQDGFVVVNARIGLRGAEGRWGIDFWAQNVLNERYQQIGFDAPLQGSGTTRQTAQSGVSSTALYGAFLGEPRTYGVTARFKF